MSRLESLLAEFGCDRVEHIPVGKATTVVATPPGIKRENYRAGTRIPIIDQGQSVIAGFTDDTSLSLPAGEYIVFGDHTRLVKWIDFPFAVGADGTKVLKAAAGFLPKFLFYAIGNLSIPDRGYNRHWTFLRELSVPRPPQPVQLEIVRTLDQFAQLEIELRAALESELEGRRRQYAYYRDQLVTGLNASAIRKIPIGELAGDGFFSDGDWVETRDQDPSGDVRLTQLADVGVETFRDRSDRWMREDQATRLGCTFLEPGDVLVARMPDPLGRACQVPADIGPAVTVVDVAILRSKRPDILPRYVMYAINSKSIGREILSFQTGGTRQRISRINLASIEIPVPAFEEQEAIVQLLDSLNTVMNDLSVELPAELNARRKQYEYYRDKLLTFEEGPA